MGVKDCFMYKSKMIYASQMKRRGIRCGYLENYVHQPMTRRFYEARAKSIIKDLRESRQLSYEELALRLEAQGAPIDVQVLINRVNRGRYSFAFAMQLMSVMGVDTLMVPKPKSVDGIKAK